MRKVIVLPLIFGILLLAVSTALPAMFSQSGSEGWIQDFITFAGGYAPSVFLLSLALLWMSLVAALAGKTLDDRCSLQSIGYILLFLLALDFFFLSVLRLTVSPPQLIPGILFGVIGIGGSVFFLMQYKKARDAINSYKGKGLDWLITFPFLLPMFLLLANITNG